MDRTHGSDDMQAEQRELANEEALERWLDFHGPFDDLTDDEPWGNSALTAGERNR